jgi:PHD/YefM family antitoxin component YafN of YafNO toxin-antitoxin module
MINVTSAKFETETGEMLRQALLFNETVNIISDEGNAVLISEEEYNNIIETMNFFNDREMKEKLIDGKNEAIEDCVAAYNS